MPRWFGRFARLGEDLFGLRLRLTQVLLQDVGRQVVAGHVAHERLGDQVKGRDMGAETLAQFKGGVEAGRRRRRLIDVNQKILDRHRSLHREKGGREKER